MESSCYYHVSYLENMESILTHGLVVGDVVKRRCGAFGELDRIYFCKSREDALQLAPPWAFIILQKNSSVHIQYGVGCDGNKWSIKLSFLK